MSDGNLKALYPGINSRVLFRSELDWIVEGLWDEALLKNEIEEMIRLSRAPSSKDKLKNNRIFDIEDDDIKNGLKDLLYDCNEGKLTLDEYVGLISNLSWVRRLEIPTPVNIEWYKINQGIEKKIEILIQNVADEDRIHSIISEENRQYFTDEELRAYDIIRVYRDNGGVSFERNRKNYLEALEQNTIKAFAISQNKRFNIFDEEMAKATIEAYKKAAQYDKNSFPTYFAGIWGSLDREPTFKRAETISGLDALHNALEKLDEEYLSVGRKIASFSTRKFNETIDRLRDKYSLQNDENEAVNPYEEGIVAADGFSDDEQLNMNDTGKLKQERS